MQEAMPSYYGLESQNGVTASIDKLTVVFYHASKTHTSFFLLAHRGSCRDNRMLVCCRVQASMLGRVRNTLSGMAPDYSSGYGSNSLSDYGDVYSPTSSHACEPLSLHRRS